MYYHKLKRGQMDFRFHPSIHWQEIERGEKSSFFAFFPSDFPSIMPWKSRFYPSVEPGILQSKGKNNTSAKVSQTCPNLHFWRRIYKCMLTIVHKSRIDDRSNVGCKNIARETITYQQRGSSFKKIKILLNSTYVANLIWFINILL